MSVQDVFLVRLQATVFVTEVAVLAGMFALAAHGSPEFALGPIGRLLAAAVLPLPCHLLLVVHFAGAGRLVRRKGLAPVITPQPRPLAA